MNMYVYMYIYDVPLHTRQGHPTQFAKLLTVRPPEAAHHGPAVSQEVSLFLSTVVNKGDATWKR